MDKNAVIERVKQYADLVKENFDVRKVILYGSYAKGTARENSDIDVAIILDRLDDDLLMSEARLFQLRRSIDVRIEPVLLEEGIDKTGFLEEIMKTGEIIYNAD
jgi:predicted nucleotidyltransferase